MARLMLSVGDLQAWVAPVPGSVSDALRAVPVNLPDDHPLMAGDHEIGFYEPDVEGPGNFATAICGENDALMAMAAWLRADENMEARAVAGAWMERLFPAHDVSWLLP